MRDFFRALFRSRSGTAGFVLLAIFLFLAIFAPVLGLENPIAADLRARMAPPSWLYRHPLGTDELGRDIFSRIVYGARVTLTVTVAAVLLGGVVGVLLGVISGYFRGTVDRVLMRIVDIQLALPLMLLALLVVAALGPSPRNLIVTLAVTCWVRYTRIVRGQVLALREREFVQSARAIGASTWRIMLRHILPNVLTPALVVATLELARVILLEAALSFLGLGVQPPQPSWGSMLADGRVYISTAWWIVTFPGLAIVFTVLGVNLLGDWLRDYFDPRQRTT